MSEVDQRSLKALASLKLTPREAEVLFWISEGKSNQDIGVILGASTGTICKHVEHILSKLNVENRTAAAVVALKTSGYLAQRTKNMWRRPPAALAIFVAEQISEIWLDGCEIYSAITPLIA
jgi:DNA-binding CsgD family transcriptional regulator